MVHMDDHSAVRSQQSECSIKSKSDVGMLLDDRSFDPLRLGVNKDNLKWFREAELTNGRWAMAAVVGKTLTLRVSTQEQAGFAFSRACLTSVGLRDVQASCSPTPWACPSSGPLVLR